MKKNYNVLMRRILKVSVLSIATLLIANIGFAQQIIVENNFNNDLGGWDVVHTSGNSDSEGWSMVTSGPNMGAEDLPPYAGSGMAMFNAYNIASGNTYELNSPALTFAESDYKLSFQMYRYDDYPEATDRIEVFYNTVAGADGGISLGVVNRVLGEEPAVSEEGWYEYTFWLPVTPNEQGYISIVGISEYGYNIFIDELIVEEVSSCEKPSNISYENVTGESATINWVASPSNPAAYEYYYSTNETAPASDTAPSGIVETTSVNISGLTPLTTYYVWVRSVCDDENQSSWLAGSNLNTACGDYTADFEENFDAYDYGDVPQCWTTIIQDDSGYPDIQVDDEQSVSAPNSIRFYNSSDVSGGYYLISPKFSDLQEENHNVTFQVYRMVLYDGSTDNHYNMEVGFMTEAQNTESYQTLLNITDIVTVNQWKKITVDLADISVNEGHIVIKYNPTEGGDYNKFFIDDFAYKSSISVNDIEMENSVAKVFPNPFNSTITIKNIDNVQWIKVLDVTGRMIKTFAPQKELNLETLQNGTYIINFDYKDGTIQNIKVIKE